MLLVGKLERTKNVHVAKRYIIAEKNAKGKIGRIIRSFVGILGALINYLETIERSSQLVNLNFHYTNSTNRALLELQADGEYISPSSRAQSGYSPFSVDASINRFLFII